MTKIERLRKKINKIDTLLLEILAKRKEIAKAIGNVKKEEKLPVYDMAREKEVFARVMEEGKTLGLDPKIVKEIYKLIMLESKEAQR